MSDTDYKLKDLVKHCSEIWLLLFFKWYFKNTDQLELLEWVSRFLTAHQHSWAIHVGSHWKIQDKNTD